MMRNATLATATAAILFASPSHADLVADWMDGSVQSSTPVAAKSGPGMDLKFGHPAPPVSIVPPVWRAGIEAVKVATKDQLRFKEYGGGTLIGPKDGFKAVRGGVAEWASCYTQSEGRGFEMSRIFEQPFIAPSNPMATVRIAQELATKYFVPEFARSGVHFGTFAAFVPADIMSKKPIRKWEDLAGLKVVAQGFPTAVAKAMGATFVNIPYPELYVAIQQGLADAVIWVDGGFIPYKISEVAKYHTTVGLTGSGIHHCYSKEWFGKLPADQQAAFYSAQEPLGMAIAKVVGINFRIKARDTYKAQGVEMIELAPAELQRWRDKLAPVVEEWMAEREKEGKPGRELVADIKRLAEKYESMTPDQLMKLALEQPIVGIK